MLKAKFRAGGEGPEQFLAGLFAVGVGFDKPDEFGGLVVSGRAAEDGPHGALNERGQLLLAGQLGSERFPLGEEPFLHLRVIRHE